MNREILSFHQDERSEWVATLTCGHTIHMRHNPPWQNRPWVNKPIERHERIGVAIACAYCTAAAG